MASFNCWGYPIHLNSPLQLLRQSHSPFLTSLILPRTEDHHHHHHRIMSHRRPFSQGNVPFSWEEKPGVSKFNHQQIPLSAESILPPPPPSAAPTPSRRSSSSLKGMIQDDPFMMAFLKCTRNQNSSKTVHNNNNSGDHHHHHQRKKSSSVGLLSSKKDRLFFLCKNALADVEVDNFIKFSNLPPLPGHKDSIKLHR